MFFVFDGLKQTIWARADSFKTRRQSADALVMKRRAVDRSGRHRFGDLRTLNKLHGVQRELCADRKIGWRVVYQLARVWQVAEMLHEGAAQDNIGQLHAATHR